LIFAAGAARLEGRLRADCARSPPAGVNGLGWVGGRVCRAGRQRHTHRPLAPGLWRFRRH